MLIRANSVKTTVCLVGLACINAWLIAVAIIFGMPVWAQGWLLFITCEFQWDRSRPLSTAQSGRCSKALAALIERDSSLIGQSLDSLS